MITIPQLNRLPRPLVAVGFFLLLSGCQSPVDAPQPAPLAQPHFTPLRAPQPLPPVAQAAFRQALLPAFADLLPSAQWAAAMSYHYAAYHLWLVPLAGGRHYLGWLHGPGTGSLSVPLYLEWLEEKANLDFVQVFCPNGAQLQYTPSRGWEGQPVGIRPRGERQPCSCPASRAGWPAAVTADWQAYGAERRSWLYHHHQGLPQGLHLAVHALWCYLQEEG